MPLPALILMARRPTAGATKTRLCPPLTPVQAAELYGCLLTDAIALADSIPGVEPWIAYAPAEAAGYFTAIAPGFRLTPQDTAEVKSGVSHRGTTHPYSSRPGDMRMSRRMARVLQSAFDAGCPSAALLASDAPHLPAESIRAAFAALRPTGDADLAVAPSSDGGYNLIALCKMIPEFFELEMSTPVVLAETLERAQSLGLRATLLAETFDIDDWKDVERLMDLLDANPGIPAERTRSWLRIKTQD